MLQSPVPKQSLASSKQNLSCRGVFCVPQIDGLYCNVVQLPKSQDYICLPHDVAAGSNDLFVCEIYITPRSPAPSDLCASASFHYLNLALKIFPTYAPERRFPPPWSVEEQDACFVVQRPAACLFLFRGGAGPAIGGGTSNSKPCAPRRSVGKLAMAAQPRRGYRLLAKKCRIGHSSMSNLTPCASGSCIPKLTVLVARRI
jgi:hypothetical protein